MLAVALPGIRTEKPSPSGASATQPDVSALASGLAPGARLVVAVAVTGGRVGDGVGMKTAECRGTDEEQPPTAARTSSIVAMRRIA